MGESEPKHEEVPFGTDYPPTNQLHSYSLPLWKLMSYVGNRPCWLEERTLGGGGLIWIARDSLELSISAASVAEKVVDLCFSWQRLSVCVRFTGVQQRPTHPLVAGLGGEQRVGGGHWNTVRPKVKANTLCQNQTKNVLVQMSLRDEISSVKSKNHCSAATVPHEDNRWRSKSVFLQQVTRPKKKKKPRLTQKEQESVRWNS